MIEGERSSYTSFSAPPGLKEVPKEVIMDTQEKTETAERFATLKDGEIATIAEANPPHELLSNQIMLTKMEYFLLYKLDGKFNLDEVLELTADIKGKIKANGS